MLSILVEFFSMPVNLYLEALSKQLGTKLSVIHTLCIYIYIYIFISTARQLTTVFIINSSHDYLHV